MPNYRLAHDYDFDNRVEEIFKRSGICCDRRYVGENNNKSEVGKREAKKRVCKQDDISKDDLKRLVRKFTFVEVASMYGVTDNAVKKWCAHYGLPKRRKDISTYSDEEWKEL